MANEMNVIWKKDKLQKYSKESLTSPALAAGDSVELHCRLCGASDHLQLIINDRLDETLRLYFGVQVPPEGVICDSCVKCMKITEGFSALVHASFKTVSEDSSRHTRIFSEFSPGVTALPATNPQKEILSLLKTKLSLDNPKRRETTRRKITKTNSNFINKKMIVACTVCGHKYPMFITDGGVKKFVCSRCQKEISKDCKKNYTQSIVNQIELRSQKDFMRKNVRLNHMLKKPHQIKQNQSATKFDHLTKHQCGQCPKKYAVAENLATHIKTVHVNSSYFICTICEKKLRSKDNLEKHLKEHTGMKAFKCTECVRIFRSNRALQAHLAFHEKQKFKSYSS